MGRKTKSKTNCNTSTVRLYSNADMIFQNFDIALYIKEFIPSKHALPFYLTCKSTMSTSRRTDNEFEAIETSMNGICSPSLLRWAIDMDIPVTRQLFAEVCGRGVLSDVKMLHEKYKCTWGHSAFMKAISTGHLHIVKYLQAENGLCCMYLFRYAIENGNLDVLKWLWTKYKHICNKYRYSPNNTKNYDLSYSPFESACHAAAKYNHMNVLAWIESADIHMSWGYACDGAAESGNVQLLEWL
jgi:hypothetical protein